jgi:6-phosphogluconolactonase
MSRKIFSDAESLVEGAAGYIADLAVRSIADRGRFTFVLSGGNTPKPVYQRLAQDPYRQRIDWSRVEIFFGDERCVPPDDPRSNCRMACETLLEHVPVPAGNIYRMLGEEAPEQAAAAYTAVLENALRGKVGESPTPSFDLVLLGMGDNGHTASLFPGLPAVTEQVRWVMAQYVEVVGMWRLTLTPVILNAARNVAFLVSGADKAEMVSRVVEGVYQPIVLPSQVVRPTPGELVWLLDAGAASKLRSPA